MVKTSFINECKLFENFTEKEREILSHYFNEVFFAKGETLFEEGNKADEIFFVREGKIGLYKSDNFGNLTKVAEVQSGTPLGECAFFLNAHHSLRAIAEEDVKALSISRRDYEILKKEYPSIAIRLVELLNEIMSERLKEENKKFADIFCFFRFGGQEWSR